MIDAFDVSKRCFFKFSLAAGFLLFISANSFLGAEESKASEKMVVTAESAVEIALKNNISIKRGEITLKGLERSKNNSWNSVSPTLSLGGSASTSNKDFGETWNAGLTATASLSFSPNLFTTIKNAKIAYENGELTFEETKRTISNSAENAFYELLYGLDYLALQEQHMKTLENIWLRNKERYKTGRVSEIDTLSAEVNYKAQIPSFESAKATVASGMDEFKQILGIPLETEIELQGSLSMKTDELKDVKFEVTEEQLENVPSIKKLNFQIAQAKTNLTASRFSAYAPSVSASWTYNPTWKLPESKLKSTEKNGEDGGSLRLSATIPLDGILPWSQKAEKISSSKDSLKDLELQLENEKKNVRLKAASILRYIRQIQATLASQAATINLAKKTCEMTEEAYNLGKKSLTDLQNAQDSYMTKEVEMKKRTYELISDILSLKKLLGE